MSAYRSIPAVRVLTYQVPEMRIKGEFSVTGAGRVLPDNTLYPIHFKKITSVTQRPSAQLTLADDAHRVPQGGIVKDIYEVLRKKQAQLAQLGKQIEALQQAAEQLRSVAHLLDSEDDEVIGASAGRL